MVEITTGEWVEVYDERAFQKALELCKGVYQQNLVRGYEALSGSTLRGKAASQYGGKYAVSRNNLLTRLRKAGLPIGERRGKHNRRILVIGIEISKID